MNERLDIEAIYRHARQRWLKEEAPRRSFREILTGSVPYWIVIVAFVLYGLSAPHTAGVFDKLTPGWGFIAPVGVEFGLLYAAFRRRLAHTVKEALPLTLWSLEILLFVTAMLVNGAGSFVSVIATTELDALSFAAIIESFGNLPATSQAALVMALLSAFIIPIGALVAGEGLAALALERRNGGDHKEARWQEVEFTIIYRAVFVRYLQHGLPEREARQRANAEVKGFLAKGHSSGVRLLSAGDGQPGQNGHLANGQVGQNTSRMVEHNYSVKHGIQTHLDANPGLDQLSINQVLVALKSEGIKGGRTTVAEVLQERKQTSGILVEKSS